MEQFKTIKIKSQIWMAENLNVGNFRNGDAIPEAKTAEEWKTSGDLKKPAWCYYDNDPANGIKYGKLYNWYAVNDPRGLAPLNWHIPSDIEWAKLIEAVGGRDVAGNKLKEAGTTHWESSNQSVTNTLGFTALPGGYRSYNRENKFESIGLVGVWWTSTQYLPDVAWNRDMMSFLPTVGRSNYLMKHGLSVRCIVN